MLALARWSYDRRDRLESSVIEQTRELVAAVVRERERLAFVVGEALLSCSLMRAYEQATADYQGTAYLDEQVGHE